jgi:hypothetical protein
MGAHKFALFISREDAQVQLANDAVGPNGAKIWENPTITKVRVIGYQVAGTKNPVYTDVAGGAGRCPMEIDFGDGTKEKLLIHAQKPFTHVVEHAFTKPGALWLKARALPGCNREGTVVAIVKGWVPSAALVQLASVGGEPLVGIVVVAANVAIARLLSRAPRAARSARRRPARLGGGRSLGDARRGAAGDPPRRARRGAPRGPLRAAGRALAARRGGEPRPRGVAGDGGGRRRERPRHQARDPRRRRRGPRAGRVRLVARREARSARAGGRRRASGSSRSSAGRASSPAISAPRRPRSRRSSPTS